MIFITAIAIGILSISLLSVLPSTNLLLVVILASLCTIFSGYFIVISCLKNKANYVSYYKFLQWLLWLVFGFLIGVCYGYISAVSLIAKQLPIDLDNKVFMVDGLVTGIVKKSSSSVRFDFTINDLLLIDDHEHLSIIDKQKDNKIRLSYYFHNKDHDFVVNTGDHWKFLVKLKRPRGFVNPIGFDYQGYLLSKNISATGYVKKSNKNKKLGNKCGVYFFNIIVVDCIRNKLNSFLELHFSSSKVLGMLTGLLIGERTEITKAQWNILKNTGTIHLLAISGLHIGLAAAIGYWLGKFIQRCLQFIIYSFGCPLKYLGFCRLLPSINSILFALVYSLLAGFSLPTQRSLIMILAFHFGLLCYRNIRPWSLFAIALLGVALIDPLAIYSRGFWLSFIAVGSLIVVFNSYLINDKFVNKNLYGNYFYYMFQNFKKSIINFSKSFLKAQLAVFIGLLIPSIILLKGISGLSFLANFIAIPLVTMITVPLLLLSLLLIPMLTSAAIKTIELAANSIEFLLYILQRMQAYGVNFWDFSIGDPSFLSILTAGLGIVYLLMPKGIPLRSLGLVCLLPLFFSVTNNSLLKVTVFDVGQGTAVVVETPDFEMIYDTGKKFSDSFNIGEHILSPYLKDMKRKNIDQLIISHNDLDHSGGVEGLLKQISVKNIYVGEIDKNQPLNAKQCFAGQKWWWNNVSFTVVWPTREFVKTANILRQKAESLSTGVLTKSNNLSCVVLIQYQSTSILLAGDIESSVERSIIKNQLVPHNINILLAPHHGSQTSSHKAWIDYLKPEYVVFSAGYKNSYGHPHRKVVARYKRYNSILLNTATDGAIQFVIDANNTLNTYQSRVVSRHYWHDGSKP